MFWWIRGARQGIAGRVARIRCSPWRSDERSLQVRSPWVKLLYRDDVDRSRRGRGDSTERGESGSALGAWNDVTMRFTSLRTLPTENEIIGQIVNQVPHRPLRAERGGNPRERSRPDPSTIQRVRIQVRLLRHDAVQVTSSHDTPRNSSLRICAHLSWLDGLHPRGSVLYKSWRKWWRWVRWWWRRRWNRRNGRLGRWWRHAAWPMSKGHASMCCSRTRRLVSTVGNRRRHPRSGLSERLSHLDARYARRCNRSPSNLRMRMWRWRSFVWEPRRVLSAELRSTRRAGCGFGSSREVPRRHTQAKLGSRSF